MLLLGLFAVWKCTELREGEGLTCGDMKRTGLAKRLRDQPGTGKFASRGER